MPASFYAATTGVERAVFGVRNGIYGLPTEELVSFVRRVIGGRSAIEIGAGHGGFARALGIRATDSHLQSDPLIAAQYAALGQAVIRYGEDVDEIDAHAAVAMHRPKVVVASWVTHRFDPREPWREGNAFGVDEAAIVAACETYVFVGNARVHAAKPIWSLPHRRFEPGWVYSRTIDATPDLIAVWGPGDA